MPTAPIIHHFGPDSEAPDVDVLWWSGGKDSFLSLLALLKEGSQPLLLSTIHARSGIVGLQGFEHTHLIQQAKHMNVDIVIVPLTGEYIDAIRLAFKEIQKFGKNVKRLVFGDLHLEGVRKWRETNLRLLDSHNVEIPFHYPLWKVPYDELLSRLESSNTGTEVVISASERPEIKIGTKFDRHFIASLPPDIDAFGENGEFHTKVQMM